MDRQKELERLRGKRDAKYRELEETRDRIMLCEGAADLERERFIEIARRLQTDPENRELIGQLGEAADGSKRHDGELQKARTAEQRLSREHSELVAAIHCLLTQE